jgi:hypothetical protein
MNGQEIRNRVKSPTASNELHFPHNRPRHYVTKFAYRYAQAKLAEKGLAVDIVRSLFRHDGKTCIAYGVSILGEDTIVRLTKLAAKRYVWKRYEKEFNIHNQNK